MDMENGTDSLPAADAEGTPSLSSVDLSGARTEKFVSFRIGDGSYAVLAAAVSEVIHPLPLTPLPETPPGMLGISPLRGEIIATVDLRRLLGEAAAKAADPKAKQIVLKRTSRDVVPIAFSVDRLGEIATFELSAIRAPARSSEFLIGEAGTDGRIVKVIDHSKLSVAIETA